MLTICYLPPQPGHIKTHLIFGRQIRSNRGTILARFGFYKAFKRHFDKHGHRNIDSDSML